MFGYPDQVAVWTSNGKFLGMGRQIGGRGNPLLYEVPSIEFLPPPKRSWLYKILDWMVSN